MKFSLNENEQKSALKFLKHRCPMANNTGAAGGRISYTFTCTSLGDIVKISCACGKEEDITDISGF